MAHATIAVLNLGPEGLTWNRFCLAAAVCISQIHFLHSGHRAGCAISSPLILVAFITGNSSLEPLIEGLYAQIHVNLR